MYSLARGVLLPKASNGDLLEKTLPDRTTCSLAIIGFGGVGANFSKGFLAAGGRHISDHDNLFDDPSVRAGMVLKARPMGVRVCGSAAEAENRVDVVIELLTSRATAERIDRAADLVDREPGLENPSDKVWRTALEAIAPPCRFEPWRS